MSNVSSNRTHQCVCVCVCVCMCVCVCVCVCGFPVLCVVRAFRIGCCMSCACAFSMPCAHVVCARAHVVRMIASMLHALRRHCACTLPAFCMRCAVGQCVSDARCACSQVSTKFRSGCCVFVVFFFASCWLSCLSKKSRRRLQGAPVLGTGCLLRQPAPGPRAHLATGERSAACSESGDTLLHPDDSGFQEPLPEFPGFLGRPNPPRCDQAVCVAEF